MAEHAFCRVDPGATTLLRTVGWLFVAATLIALTTGRAYYRRVYAREIHPGRYWQTVASYLLLAVFILGGLSLC